MYTKSEYRVDMLGPARSTVVDGTRLAWTELGEGAPVVLLHGLADSHRTWRRVAPRLGARFRVLLLDLPGHGLSERPDAPYTLEWYARTVLRWLDAVGVERAHVVGHSFGGGVAQWMVLDGRERVDRLVLVAPGGLGREVNLGLRLSAVPVLAPLLAQPLMRAGTQIMMRAATGAAPELDEIARAAAMNSAPRTGMAYARTVAGCIGLRGQYMQTWDRIHEIPSLPPITVVWGERDRILPIKQAWAARDRLNDVTFSAYARVGHFPQLEASERLAGDVLAFLDAAADPPRARLAAALVPRPQRGPGRLSIRGFARLFSALRATLRRVAVRFQRAA